MDTIWRLCYLLLCLVKTILLFLVRKMNASSTSSRYAGVIRTVKMESNYLTISVTDRCHLCVWLCNDPLVQDWRNKKRNRWRLITGTLVARQTWCNVRKGLISEVLYLWHVDVESKNSCRAQMRHNDLENSSQTETKEKIQHNKNLSFMWTDKNSSWWKSVTVCSSHPC